MSHVITPAILVYFVLSFMGRIFVHAPKCTMGLHLKNIGDRPKSSQGYTLGLQTAL